MPDPALETVDKSLGIIERLLKLGLPLSQILLLGTARGLAMQLLILAFAFLC